MISEAITKELQASLRGQLLTPADSEYDTARKVFNAMIDKRPKLIARCAGAADVIRCVQFAREHELPLSARGGGHSVSGASVSDGGLMIDFSRMKGIRVDPARRTALAQPGLILGEFDRETQAFGLATTLGIVSMTGIAGLTLGGGLGWLMGKHGLACDNLLSADVVTAEGKLVSASASENADLFWALRGAGANFGVVTSLEYRLHPVTGVLGGLVLYDMSQAKDVFRFYGEFSRSAPDELGSAFGMLTAPDGNPVAGIVAVYNGPTQEAEKILKPLRSFGTPLADLIQPMSYVAAQSIFDASYPRGLYHYWKSGFLRELNDGAMETMISFAQSKATPGCQVFLEHLHGAARRVPTAETAFANRDNAYNLGIFTITPNPAETDKNIRWARELWAALQPYVAGRVYVNYLGADEADRIREAYGPNYERLAALKKKYDPTNFFRLNQNIRPAA
jgi:FAD/FMN-containing dehydrogenase